MTRRTLALTRETLAELTDDELTGIVGGDALTPSCPLVLKLSELLGCHGA